MTEPYRILIVEDDPDDVELILLGFSKHDEFFVDVASTGEEGLEMASGTRYDLVSVDYALPKMSGIDVLEEIRKADQDVPVVMVTGRGTEELQVVAFEKAATSYVMKSVDSFRSLPTIFEALISESRFRSQERRMRREMERSEAVSRYILENSPTGIYVLQNGCFRMVNSKFAEIFGCDKEELIGEHFWSLAEPESFECVDAVEGEDDPEGRERSARAEPSGGAIFHEFWITRRDGSRRWVEARIAPLDYQEERWVLGNLVDVTERKVGEMDLLREKRRLSVLNSLALKVIDLGGEIDDLLNAALSELVSGPEGFEVGGIFLLHGSDLVLRGLSGPLEDLMSFLDHVDAEGLLVEAEAYEAVDPGRRIFWASAPFFCGDERRGLLVLGRERKVEPDLLEFVDEVASHIGKMAEAFERLRPPPR